MIRHLFLLIWNRKRTNALLVLELLFSFLVLFGVGALLVNFSHHYRLAPGFSHAQVWRLNIAAQPGQQMPRPLLDDVLRQVRALPGVQEMALGSFNTPFRGASMGGNFEYEGRKSSPPGGYTEYYDADDHYAATLGLHLREGRWFQPADDAAGHRPAVISRQVREALFGPGGSVVGKVFRAADPQPGHPADEFVVLGVVDDVRKDGDFSDYQSSVWRRLVPHDTTSWQEATVLVKVAPGQGAALQQRIVHTVAGPAARQWSTEVRTLEADRRDRLRLTLAPLLGLGLVGSFLIMNVALGLFGVLWLNISQRRAELGVRRAMGATASAVSGQVLGETLVLTTFGLGLGLLVAVQFPLLGVFNVRAGVYGLAMLLATGALYALAAACALYPSRLAAGIRPAVALREE